MQLLHQLPLRADREQDLQKTGPDQPFRRDRGAPEADVKPFEISVEAGEGVVDHLPDLAQWVPSRDPVFRVGIAEKRTAHLVRARHRDPAIAVARGESCSASEVEADYFSALLME